MTETCFFLIWNGWHQEWKLVTELVWYHVFSKSSFTVLGNRSAYIARTGWRESSLWKFVVNSILPQNLFKNMWPSSNLFPYTAKLFAYSLLHRKYAELLKVIGNRSSTLTPKRPSVQFLDDEQIPTHTTLTLLHGWNSFNFLKILYWMKLIQFFENTLWSYCPI